MEQESEVLKNDKVSTAKEQESEVSKNDKVGTAKEQESESLEERQSQHCRGRLAQATIVARIETDSLCYYLHVCGSTRGAFRHHSLNDPFWQTC